MKYRHEIDGLRALAILPVIFFHAGFSFFSGGYVGVDIFFVISGYLITSIIMLEMMGDKFSIINFYERRARRILPALFFVIILCTPVAWSFMLPDEFKNFGQSIFANVFFVSNFLFWLESGYFFAGTSELKPLLHTWSLAVEEQFYVLFPLTLLALWKFGQNKIFLFLSFIFALSLFFSHYSSIYFPEASFYLLPSRAWELLLGSGAAFIFIFHKEIISSRSKLFSEVASITGIALIIFSIYFFDEKTHFPGFHALLPTIGTVLIILFCNSATIVGRFLGAKILVGFGLISYSLYVFHQPIFVFGKMSIGRELLPLEHLILIILSIILAFLSWKYVESPFRNRSVTSRKFIFTASFTSMLILASVGLGIHINKGFPDRFKSLNIDNMQFAMPSIANDWCFYDVNSNTSLELGEKGLDCNIGDPEGSFTALLFGDSYAGHYEPAMDIVGKSANLNIHSVTTNWCFPSTNYEFGGPKAGRMYDQCKFNRDYFSKNLENYDVIILSGDWSKLYSQEKFEGIFDAITFSASISPLVVILPAPKKFNSNILDLYKRSKIFNFQFNSEAINAEDDKIALEINDVLKNYSQNFENVFFIQRASFFNRLGIESDVTEENIPFSYDGGHISIYGSLNAGKNFIQSDQYDPLVNKLKRSSQ